MTFSGPKCFNTSANSLSVIACPFFGEFLGKGKRNAVRLTRLGAKCRDLGFTQPGPPQVGERDFLAVFAAESSRHDATDFRRQKIAHGVNPRPLVHNSYSGGLPDLFTRLAECIDAAVRLHLVNALGVLNPWPP